ncbi:MAG: sigma-70 family RNA polymerase sigma factor [Phycisphaerales bacterium]|nr:sigma-70 family RNA polymerase sigma factor [Phycisphaerales bacterium]
MSEPGNPNVTLLLAEMRAGNPTALERLLPIVYDELRRLAGSVFRGQPEDHTLQPTALVHEVFLRLAGRDELAFNDRQHFFRVAAQAMRQLLTDHARAARAQRRGGDRERVFLDSGVAAQPSDEFDVIALDDALTRLAALDERQGRIVELRFLAGLSVDDTAAALGVSPRTVELDSRLARAWLRRALAEHVE